MSGLIPEDIKLNGYDFSTLNLDSSTGAFSIDVQLSKPASLEWMEYFEEKFAQLVEVNCEIGLDGKVPEVPKVVGAEGYLRMVTDSQSLASYMENYFLPAVSLANLGMQQRQKKLNAITEQLSKINLNLSYKSRQTENAKGGL